MSAEKLAHAILGKPFECPECGKPVYAFAIITKDYIQWFRWKSNFYEEQDRQDTNAFVDLEHTIGFYSFNCKHLFPSEELERILSLEEHVNPGYRSGP